MGAHEQPLSALGFSIACSLGGDLPPMGPPPDKLPRVLSAGECEAMADRARKRAGTTARQKLAGLRDRALVLWLWGTGCRVSELDTMVGNFNPGEGTCKVLGKGSRGRGKRERLIYVPSRVREVYRDYLAARCAGEGLLMERKRWPLFAGVQDNARPLSRWGVSKILAAIADECGIDDVTPHVFRHTCATHLLQAGVSIEYVRAYLGHVKVTTTQLYTHVIASGSMTKATLMHPVESSR